MPVEKLKIKRRAFDMSKLERVSLIAEVDFDSAPPDSLEKALALAGGDLSKLLTWTASGYRDDFVKETRKSIRSENPEVVYAPGVVLKFAANFFVRPEIAALKLRKERYAAAFAMIRANSVLLETVKMLAVAAEPEVEDEDEVEETEA